MARSRKESDVFELNRTAWRDDYVPLMRGLYGWDEAMTRRWFGAFEEWTRQKATARGEPTDFGFWNHRDEREVVAWLMFPQAWEKELCGPEMKEAMAKAFSSMPTILLVMAPKDGLIWREYRMRVDAVLARVGHSLAEAGPLKAAEVETPSEET